VCLTCPHGSLGCEGALYLQGSAKKGSGKTATAQFPEGGSVRIYWDADNIRYTKSVYSAFARLLGDVQVRAVSAIGTVQP
jgi:mono/diheme cytochrome c family protein